jgi:hypothetical protein
LKKFAATLTSGCFLVTGRVQNHRMDLTPRRLRGWRRPTPTSTRPYECWDGALCSWASLRSSTGSVCGLGKAFLYRGRSRRAAQRLWARLDRQPRAALLALSLGQDRARPQGRQAPAAQIGSRAGTAIECRARGRKNEGRSRAAAPMSAPGEKEELLPPQPILYQLGVRYGLQQGGRVSWLATPAGTRAVCGLGCRG